MNLTSTLSFSCPHCHATVDVAPQHGQELVTCPACQKPFQVSVPEAKPVAQSQPVVTESRNEAENNGFQGHPTSDDGLKLETDPPANHALIAEPVAHKEEPVATVRLAMFRRYPARCSMYSIGLMGGLVAGTISHFEGYWLLAILTFALAIYCAYKLFTWWLRIYNTQVTLTTKRFILQTGILSKENTELPLEDITQIQIGQGMVSKILGVGDLAISSNGGEQRRVVVMGVPRPGEIAALIRGPRNVNNLPAATLAAEQPAEVPQPVSL